MITVLLADDHAMVRDGLRYILEATGDIQVVATASNGKEAVAQALVHCPNVTVMDVSMPVLDGIEATKQICELVPQTRVLVLSMHHNSAYIRRALQAGALGYVLKDSAGDELVTAVRSLNMGDQYLSKAITRYSQYQPPENEEQN